MNYLLDFRIASEKSPLELFRIFSSSPEGLTQDEAEEKLKQEGSNELRGKETSWWKIAIRQFRSAFIYLLFIASAVALSMGEYLDAAFIFLFLTINALLGFIQEYRAENSLKLLKKFIHRKTRVKRSGQETTINVERIVPGDIILLKAGDAIPADGYFLHAENISVDESPLTGESSPVQKSSGPLSRQAQDFYEARNIGFSQTTLVSGGGELLVFATGPKTVIGDIAQKMEETQSPSAFEISISHFSSFILKLVLITIPLVFLTNALIHGGDFRYGEFLIFSIALTVSVIPEALPLVTTLSITQGALKMARMHVVSRRLSAIEDLGSIQVLCTDKTGTLTENKLQVAEIYGQKNEVLAVALLTLGGNLRQKEDVFAQALKEVAPKDFEKWLKKIEVLDDLPFDPIRRRQSILVSNNRKNLLYLCGAPEPFLPHLPQAQKTEIEVWVKQEGQKGRRVLAVAQKELSGRDKRNISLTDEKDAQVLGLVSFFDPIKPSTSQAIHDAESLGVRIKVLTGDSKEVAGWVGCETGIIEDPQRVLTGEEFERLSPKEKIEAVEKYDVFARTLPLQKYQIVYLLKQKYFVGFLGEGFNDAPALKLAHVAIAVEGASDIAQDASDIILLNRSLEVIVNGIKEGRKIFANTLKYIKATLTSNFGNFYALVLASLIIPYLPMLPLQILLLNLLSDFPMLSIAADSVDNEELHRPRGYNIREIASVALVLGLVSTVFDFSFFGFFVRFGKENLQTMWFVCSILTELILLFSIRTTKCFFKAKAPSLIVLGSTFIIMIITLLLPFLPASQKILSFQKPSLLFLLISFLLVGTYFIVTELVKVSYYRLFKNNQAMA